MTIPSTRYSRLPTEFDIAGKTVIVTGAARGIGKGIARVFAESGAQVMVTSLTDRYLMPLAEEMEAAGHPIIPLTADATDSDDWQRTVDTALSAWGRIDVLINNLGDAIRKPLVPPPGSDGTPITDDEWQFVMDINLTEAFKGCRAVGPHMIARGGGRVINISGFAARKGSPESAGVFGGEGGTCAPDADARARMGAIRHHRELHRAGPVPGSRDGRSAADSGIEGAREDECTAGTCGRAARGRAAGAVPCVGRVGVHDGRDAVSGRWAEPFVAPTRRVAMLNFHAI